ncbi:cupin domain-containing protein [Sphingomonas ginkgonis]|uniref:Cupin domain-containing protein n=1 Tax=Sphingomonas ginkgonis TaxID=2315330 RepID=A0A3S0ENI1_9SPHN|nr:cupin domain-containing protein [Sphingomonas ginkgonis]RST31608.1 cupin domain-containing protein [Sphingomonas ginkgonis]
MPKVELDRLTPSNRTGYPPPFHQPVAGRWQRAVGQAAGLTALGAREVTLDPGAWSSQRHWHEGEDELLVMLAGEAVLIEDEGETPVRAGDIVAWAAGVRNGHHLVNRGDAPCRFLCVSAGSDAGGGYSDIDMMFTPAGDYVKDGTPYAKSRAAP